VQRTPGKGSCVVTEEKSVEEKGGSNENAGEPVK